jgi:hypothetical protein
MLKEYLKRAPPAVFTAFCIAAAFTTYFCMYGFRKPFSAATYDEMIYWGVGYKTILVISQTLGYTLSKFIGIKTISEMPGHRRARMIVALIVVAELALLLFAITPAPWNMAFLFFNGLPLGLVFGLVYGYLEGRQLTEALAAGLCASFIVSSGFVQTVGRTLVLQGVPEFWMPFLTGLLFFPPLLIAVWFLNQIPPPDEEDVARRSERPPMSRADRLRFLQTYGLGLAMLVATYILLTVLRSIRSDFGVEIWRDLGQAERPVIFTKSETLIMCAVVAINGAAIWIRDNRRALQVSFLTVIGGFALVGFAIAGWRQGWLDGFAFMVLVGLGLYAPYVAFHTTVFERLIATSRAKGNVGFLIYLADATGYLGYIGVMLYHNFGDKRDDGFLEFFVGITLTITGLSLVAMLIGWWYFSRRLDETTVAVAAQEKG